MLKNRQALQEQSALKGRVFIVIKHKGRCIRQNWPWPWCPRQWRKKWKLKGNLRWCPCRDHSTEESRRFSPCPKMGSAHPVREILLGTVQVTVVPADLGHKGQKQNHSKFLWCVSRSPRLQNWSRALNVPGNCGGRFSNLLGGEINPHVGSRRIGSPEPWRWDHCLWECVLGKTQGKWMCFNTIGIVLKLKTLHDSHKAWNNYFLQNAGMARKCLGSLRVVPLRTGMARWCPDQVPSALVHLKC